MRIFILLLTLSCTLKTYSLSLNDLFWTKDQQGQKLMQQKKFKEAEQTFQQENWQAAAAFKAGNYENAADLYKGLKGEDNFYNQGNTLAHLGQYKEAIEAYDKALALNPKNQDTLYNRKLVEDLLKQQQQKEQQNKNQDDKNNQNENQQNKDNQGGDQQNKVKQNSDQDKGPKGDNQEGKNQQDKDQQNKGQEGKNPQDQEQQSKEEQNKGQQDKEQQNQGQKGKDQQNKDEQDKEQEKSKEKQGKKSGKDANQSAKEKEQQQAKEQWLRLIPDDPGGLMREKFLRDHLRRQSEWFQ